MSRKRIHARVRAGAEAAKRVRLAHEAQRTLKRLMRTLFVFLVCLSGFCVVALLLHKRSHVPHSTPGPLAATADYQLMVPAYQTGAVRQVLFRADSKVLASVAADGAVKVWDVDRGAELATLRCDHGKIQCITFSPDGRLLIGGTSDGDLLFWDRGWSRVRQLPCPGQGGVSQLGFTADGRFLESAVDNSGAIWEVQNDYRLRAGLFQDGKPTYLTHAGLASSFKFSPFAFSPTGSLIAASGGEQGLVGVPPGPHDGVSIPIAITDLATLRQRQLLGHGFRYSGLTVKPLSLPETDRDGRVFSLRGSRSVLSMSFSPDGTELASASDDFTVRVWNLKTSKARLVIPGKAPFCGVAFSPDGRFLAVEYLDGNHEAMTLELRRTSDGRLVRTLTQQIGGVGWVKTDRTFPNSVTFSPDGRYIAAAGVQHFASPMSSPDHSVVVWETATGKKAYSTDRGQMTTLAFSPDGRVLATGGLFGRVALWETAAWTPIPMRVPAEERNTYHAIYGNGDGVLFGDDGREPAYSLAHGTPVFRPGQADGRSLRVCVPASTCLLDVDDRGLAECWDVLSRKKLFSFLLPPPVPAMRDLLIGAAQTEINTRSDLLLYDARETAKGLKFGMEYEPMEVETKMGPGGESLGRSIVTAATRQTLAVGVTGSGFLDVHDLRRRLPPRRLRLPGGTLAQVGFADHGGVVYSLSVSRSAAPRPGHLGAFISAGTIVAWDVGTGRQLCRFTGVGTDLHACPSFGTPVLALRHFNVVELWNLRTARKLQEVEMTDKLRVPASDFYGLTSRYDMSSVVGQLLTIVMTHAAIALSPDGTRLAAEDAAGTFELWDIRTGRMTYASYAVETPASAYDPSTRREAQVDYPSAWEDFINFSLDGRQIFCGTLYGDIIIRDLARPQVPRVLKGHVGAALPMGLNADRTVLVTGGADGDRMWRLSDGKELLHLMVMTPRSWVAATSDGRFDGSPEGINSAYFVRGAARASVRSLFGRFYTPGLVGMAMQNRLIMGGAPTSGDALARPPSVTLTAPKDGFRKGESQINVFASVGSQGRPVDSVLAFVNGKLSFRGAFRVKAGQQLSLTIPIGLVPGDNLIELFAVDDRQAWSDVASVRVQRTGAAPAADLYVLAVGVNAYRQKPLRFACRDAQRVAREFGRASPGIYRAVHPIVLLNQAATRTKIDEQVRRITQKARPEDAFVFYFSGHGLVTRVGGGTRALLAPADLTDFNEPALCQSKGIPLDQIQAWATELAPQRQLWLFDACNSGSLARSLGDFTSSRDFQELQFGTGVYLAAATRPGDEEVANENPQVKSGLFTQVLLDGMAGPADADHNGLVSVPELGQYVLNHLPGYSDALLKEVQQPAFWEPQAMSFYPFTVAKARPHLTVSLGSQSPQSQRAQSWRESLGRRRAAR